MPAVLRPACCAHGPPPSHVQVMRFYPSFSVNDIGMNDDLTLLHIAAKYNKVGSARPGAAPAAPAAPAALAHALRSLQSIHQGLVVRWLLQKGADPAVVTKDDKMPEDLTTDKVGRGRGKGDGAAKLPTAAARAATHAAACFPSLFLLSQAIKEDLRAAREDMIIPPEREAFVCGEQVRK